MLFGLFNALVSFQGYVNKVLAKRLDIFVIVYLNDILIYTKDLRQGHINEIQWILEVLKRYDFYTNFKKCRFYKNEIRFLTYTILA